MWREPLFISACANGCSAAQNVLDDKYDQLTTHVLSIPNTGSYYTRMRLVLKGCGNKGMFGQLDIGGEPIKYCLSTKFWDRNRCVTAATCVVLGARSALTDGGFHLICRLTDDIVCGDSVQVYCVRQSW